MGVRTDTEKSKEVAHTSRSSTKARNAAQQAMREAILAKHITSNGPQDKPVADPLDFESYPLESLRKYRRAYDLDVPSGLSPYGSILNSKLGERTYSFRHRTRVEKKVLAEAVKKHFLSYPVRESEVIVDFIYAVQNQDKAFKLQFRPFQ